MHYDVVKIWFDDFLLEVYCVVVYTKGNTNNNNRMNSLFSLGNNDPTTLLFGWGYQSYSRVGINKKKIDREGALYIYFIFTFKYTYNIIHNQVLLFLWGEWSF